MDLKKRLMFSNAAIIIVPVTITLTVSFIVVFIISRIFNMDISYANFKKMADIHYEFFIADGSTLGTSPDIILDMEFQKYITSRLKSINAEIVVVKGHEKVFSTKNFSIIDVEKCLNTGKSQFFSNTIKLDAGTYIVRIIPVLFKDGENGNVILLSETGREWYTSEKLLLIVAAIFIISFVLTNIAIVFGFSRRIIKPLEKLQEAAGKISTGSLDFVVIEDGDYEIRQLCRAFEQMRLKLLEGEHNHIKYDASRKMLLSSISHDLKTPITSIKGYVEGILDGVASTPEKTEKYLKTVYSKTVHIDRMIDDLFLYSKLDLNQVPFELEKIDI
ncbi:MAG: HAMP domain-containing histidine kinase, partial [Clostridiaceae bacterium]|nr:HAMP domain-containing histidine kinase [Clostridiaceae bacterium]